MLKALLAAGMMMAVSSTGNAATHLPFIGEKGFNWVGGYGTGETIAINANGYTVIKFHGTSETEVFYKGRYKQFIPMDGGNYYYKVIGKNSIAMLDKNKKQMYGCSGEKSAPCIEKLWD